MKWKKAKQIENLRDEFTVIQWPEIQHYIDLPGFQDNSQLITEPGLYSEYGSSAYLVRMSWLLLWE